MNKQTIHNRQAVSNRAFKITDLLFLLILVGSVAFIMFTRTQGGSNQATTEAAKGADLLFAEHVSFESAAEAAREAGQPVLVFATADWCGPCQNMKATTLADASVQQSIKSVAVPYKLDVTDDASMSVADSALAQRLGVSSIPASYIVQPDGSVAASIKGSRSADAFVSWISDAVGSDG